MKSLRALVVAIFLVTPVFGQVAPIQSVATTDDVFSIRWNPAGLSFNPGSQFGVAGVLPGYESDRASYYLSSGTDNAAMGLALYHRDNRNLYHFASSSEVTQGINFGYGIQFGHSVTPSWSVGLIAHPFPFLSIGGVGMNLTSANNLQPDWRAGIAGRPAGDWLTLAADLLIDADGTVYDAEYTLSAELIAGLTLDAYYQQDNEVFGLGFGINLQHHKIAGIQDIGSDGTGRYQDPVGVYHFTSARKHSTLSPVQQDKFVKLTFNGAIVEEDPRFSLFGVSGGRTLSRLVFQIKEYASREDLAGIVLDIKYVDAALAQLHEIREALLEFKASGKKIYAYIESGGNAEYYLASVADKIYLHPSGDLWLTGVGAQLIYVKSLLEKVGVEADYIRINEYKTAGEAFTRDSASTAELEQLNDYLDDYYQVFTSSIAESKSLSNDSVRSLVDNGPYSARGALAAGLADSLLYSDEFTETVEGPTWNKEYEIISEYNFNQIHDWNYHWETPRQNKIAIINAVGSITAGESEQLPFSGSVNMGGETIAEAIKSARENPVIKAIVIRVDSPGGSALGSDIIWREIQRTTSGENAKPIIVSMGDMAASGGYYISVAADEIVANPATLTGSIGVVFGTFNFEELMSKIGVSSQTLTRGDNADLLDPTRPMTDEERDKIFQMMNDVYMDFIEKVADGRDMDEALVDSLGGGRIYSGRDARELGLIDELGGIAMAVSMARDAAGIDDNTDVELEYYPEYPMNIFELFRPSTSASLIENLPREIRMSLEEIEKYTFLTSEQMYYLLPLTLKIQN